MGICQMNEFNQFSYTLGVSGLLFYQYTVYLLVHMPECGYLRSYVINLLHEKMVSSHLTGKMRHGASQRHYMGFQTLEPLVYSLE